jgi:hypothetical protein
MLPRPEKRLTAADDRLTANHVVRVPAKLGQTRCIDRYPIELGDFRRGPDCHGGQRLGPRQRRAEVVERLARRLHAHRAPAKRRMAGENSPG